MKTNARKRASDMPGVASRVRPQDPPATQGNPEPVGIVCRTCGCRHFYVLSTRAAPSGRMIRRRECRHCGRRITTYEAPTDRE